MDGVEEQPIRNSLRTVTFAWVFGSAWFHITTGATMTRYARSMDMSEFGFGLLAAIPYFGALLQLPASYMMERYGGRKKLFLLTGILHRLLWLVIAAIPWFMPRADWWWGLLLFMAFSTSLGNFSGAAWLTWMADLVPARIRGRYFSRRGQYGRLVGFFATAAVAWLLDAVTGYGAEIFRQTISVALAVAAICGVLDIALFKSVPPAQKTRADEHVSFRELVAQPLRDPNFRRFLAFNFTLNFGIGYVGQFIWLYLFDVVQMSNLRANMMLVAIPLIVSMLSFPLWGRMVDRLGCRPTLIAAGLLIVHGGASWIFVRQESWWLGYAGSILATLAWPGVELASLNMVLRLSAAREGIHTHRGSAYVAVNSVVVALGGICSGLFGGAVAEWLSEWKGSLFGLPLTYHGVLLLISALLRAVSLLFLIGLQEPQAHHARAAFRYLATNIYNNVQQAALAPLRGIGRLGRLTYRLPSQRNRNK